MTLSRRKLRKALQIIRQTRPGTGLARYTANKLRGSILRIARSTKVAYPGCVMLELTNHCNLHCTTCPREYAYGNQMDRGYMPHDKAKAIIDELSPYLDSIGLTGLGETLLYPHLAEVARYIKQKKASIVTSFSTNANMHGFIDKVKPVLPYIDTIQISVDGIGQTYEKIRHGARFQELDSNIRQLTGMTAGKGIDIMFNMVMTKESIHDMPGIVRYASENGIPFVNFSYFNLASVTRIPVSYYSLFDTPEFQSLRTETLHTAAILKNVEVTGLGKRPRPGFSSCPFPWTHFYISWDGYMPPCCAKPFPKLLNFGNVFSDGVMHTLNSKEYRNFRTLSQNNRTPAFCNKCNTIEI